MLTEGEEGEVGGEVVGGGGLVGEGSGETAELDALALAGGVAGLALPCGLVVVEGDGLGLLYPCGIVYVPRGVVVEVAEGGEAAQESA